MTNKKNDNTYVVTRKIELTPFGATKEDVQSIYDKLREIDNNIFLAANTIVTTQYANDAIVNSMLDRDNEFIQKGKEAKARISELDEQQKEAIGAIYENYRIVIEEIKASKKPKKETNTLLTKAKSDRKEEIDKVKDKFKALKKSSNVAIRKLKQDATRLMMDNLNKSIENISYGVLAERFNFLPSQVRAALNQQVYKNFTEDSFEVSIGKRSLRSYRKGMPIPFNISKSMVFEKKGRKKYTFKWLGGMQFNTNLAKDRSNNNIVIQRIISGEYKLCDSSIQLKGNKIFLLAAVRMPKEILPLDENKYIGVDLGVIAPAYVSTESGVQRQQIGSKNEFNEKRQRIYYRRKNLQKDLQWAKGGKGRKKKLALLEKVKFRERNFVRTANHVYSNAVVNFAINNNAGNIVLEDLSGIAKEETQSWVLRYWSYFELQTMIANKAKKHGIKVQKIKAHDTSRICSCCGHNQKENRKTQSKFVCEACGYEINADHNAAVNISRRVNRDWMNEKSEYGLKNKVLLDIVRFIWLCLRNDLFKNKKAA